MAVIPELRRKILDYQTVQDLTEDILAQIVFPDPTPPVPSGAITAFGGATAPTGYLMCDGSAVSRSTYSALFTAIGTTYGAGNGSTTFNLPDLRGKVAVGKSTDTEFDNLGETGGAKTHNHKGYGDGGDLRATIGSPYGDAGRIGFIAIDALNPNTGAAVGNYTYSVPGSASGQGTNGAFSHYTPVVGYTSTSSTIQPYQVINYIIKT